MAPSDEFKTLRINWEGPFKLEDVLTLTHDDDAGLYQVYGRHIVFGPGSFVDREGVFGHETWILKELDLDGWAYHWRHPVHAVLQRVGSQPRDSASSRAHLGLRLLFLIRTSPQGCRADRLEQVRASARSTSS